MPKTPKLAKFASVKESSFCKTRKKTLVLNKLNNCYDLFNKVNRQEIILNRSYSTARSPETIRRTTFQLDNYYKLKQADKKKGRLDRRFLE